jgi:hypothetical protein
MTEALRPKRYRLYLDESGDHAYALLDAPTHRYLGLLGVWFREKDDYVAFSDDLEAFKRDLFGPRPDEPVLLHRTEIINRRGPFGILVNPDKQREFDDKLLTVIARARFRMVCAVINKKEHRDRYITPMHPYHYCLQAVLDRYCGWLNYKNAVGDVVAETRGKKEDRQLLGAYKTVYSGGTLMFQPPFHGRALTTTEVKIRRKENNIPGLQLADTLAHPVKQAMLRERGVIEDDPRDVFGPRIVSAAEPKFNRDETTTQVWGYGKIWL